MCQETEMVRASAGFPALPKSLGCVPASIVAVIFLVVALLLSGAFAAESAKPDSVARVRSPKTSSSAKVPSVKPAECAPKSDGQTKALPEASPATAKGESNSNKDASGAAANDLSVNLSSHEESGKAEGRAASGNAEADENAGGNSNGLEVRLKDKEINSTPAPSPAQCTLPGASPDDEAPAPH